VDATEGLQLHSNRAAAPYGFRRRVAFGQIALTLASFALLIAGGGSVQAQPAATPDAAMSEDVLTDAQWQQLDAATDRGLTFLASQQRSDGSFTCTRSGQPGVTSLAVLAFLSRGHTPDSQPYGPLIRAAVRFVLGHQQSNGMISGYNGERPNYHHAISALMLCEIYGMSDQRQNEQIEPAITRAVEFSRMQQTRRKRNPQDNGGWRYLTPNGPNDSDLTATSWNLMFYRSAKNCGYDIPVEYVNDAVAYVRRCYDPALGGFVYGLSRQNDEHYVSGASAGGGILALSLGGQHGDPRAKQTAQWILAHGFDRYNWRDHRDDRYHYSAFYSSQGMFQVGGDEFAAFFPPLMNTLIANQDADGGWQPERFYDRDFGQVYSTSFAVLALSAPYQMLPIFQR
jgi:hypothetical protein